MLIRVRTALAIAAVCALLWTVSTVLELDWLRQCERDDGDARSPTTRSAAAAAHRVTRALRNMSCEAVQRLVDDATVLGRGANKVAYRSRVADVDVCIKLLDSRQATRLADDDDAHNNDNNEQFWQQKAHRSFLLEQIWLTELRDAQASPVPRLFATRRDCGHGLASVSVVEFVPFNLFHLDASYLPPCVWLQLAVEFASFLLWLEAPMLRRADAEADDASLVADSHRSLMLCDWKLDQFGLTADMKLKLVDVDSLQWYHALLPLYADAKCKGGVLRLRRSCAGGAECLQHAVRVWRSAPEEFWCNNDTKMCDGFNSASNVFGLGQTVLQPLFDEAAASFDASIRRRVNSTLLDMVAYERRRRPSPSALLATFRSLYDEAGGDKCARQFRKADGLKKAVASQTGYNTTTVRERFHINLPVGSKFFDPDFDGDDDGDDGDEDGDSTDADDESRERRNRKNREKTNKKKTKG
jgi:hypothetical protein